MAIKKALFLNKFYFLIKENKLKTPDDVFKNLPFLYEELKKDTEIGMEGLSYQDFLNAAQQGYYKAVNEIHMHNFMSGF